MHSFLHQLPARDVTLIVTHCLNPAPTASDVTHAGSYASIYVDNGWINTSMRYGKTSAITPQPRQSFKTFLAAPFLLAPIQWSHDHDCLSTALPQNGHRARFVGVLRSHKTVTGPGWFEYCVPTKRSQGQAGLSTVFPNNGRTIQACLLYTADDLSCQRNKCAVAKLTGASQSTVVFGSKTNR